MNAAPAPPPSSATASPSARVARPPSSSTIASPLARPPAPGSNSAAASPLSRAPSDSARPPPSKRTGAAALADAAPLSKPGSPAERLSLPGEGVPASRPSRRPLPPKFSTRPPSGFDFDEGSIAQAFDALLSEGSSGAEGRATVDLAPVRELFAELAANHMRHVRDFMIDVKWGEAPREWIEICVPAVVSLHRAAERLELGDLALGLERFGAELRASTSESARTIEGVAKDRLLASYEQLVASLPQAFALEQDTSQREAVIVQSLCLSVPDVRKVTIDKLHAAGLTSLKTLFGAKPEEIAEVAGIPEALAQRIVERFQAYRTELQNASPQDARAAERERLATLNAQLLEQHNGYEEASRGWSPDAKAKKRELFRAREETWLSISLLLARFGEVERIQGIEKVPYAQRITQLTAYLEEAGDKYRAE
jgi:hypothetical protein